MSMDFFQKLRSSNLISIFKQETDEPQHVATNGLSDELARLNRISGYSGEIERVKKEMDLAIIFVDKSSEELLSEKSEISPDEYILYHYGAFLNLVHQMKDKIAHLCDGMTTVGPYKEREGRKSGLLRQILGKEVVLKIPELVAELKKWDEGVVDKTPITYTLGKRSNHHHFRSRLTLDKNLQDYQMYRTFEKSPSDGNILTEYGKKVIYERGVGGFKAWHESIVRELKELRAYIEESIQNISKALYENCELPAREADFAIVFDTHQKMWKALEIVNLAARNKVDSEFEPMIALIEKSIPDILGDNLLALYLVGSVPRGEAVVGMSDLSLVIVLRNDREEIVRGLEGLMDDFGKKLGSIGASANIKVLSLDAFLSGKNEKTRFYCKTDGVLLAGEDVVPDEKYPKPGLQLAALLNSDASEMISGIRRILDEESSTLSRLRVRQLARDMSKITLRVFYSAVLSDTAKYERSLPKIRDLINKKYPGNKTLTDILYKLATNEAIIDPDTLKELLHLYDDGEAASSVITQIEEKDLALETRKNFR